MRLFVAIGVPEEIASSIESDVVEALRPALAEARWTRPEGRHLTLKFLGEVSDERVPDVGAEVGRAVSSHRAFGAAFLEVGGFPKLQRPRVLWVGLGEGAEAMGAVARDVDAAMTAMGFSAEDRPFTAHLTLARFPRPKTIGSLPPASVPSQTFRVDEVTLFRSQLHPKGARYSALERCPLR